MKRRKTAPAAEFPQTRQRRRLNSSRGKGKDQARYISWVTEEKSHRLCCARRQTLWIWICLLPFRCKGRSGESSGCFPPQGQTDSRTSSQLSPSLVPSTTDRERTLKVRMYPNEHQKKILKRWLGASRFLYNKALATVNNGENQTLNHSEMH